MEAPEKIYIHPDIGGREFLRPWLHSPANNESVEYTRTDAFIEKACEYLKLNCENVETEDNGIMGWIPDYFIEGFVKFMRG